MPNLKINRSAYFDKFCFLIPDSTANVPGDDALHC